VACAALALTLGGTSAAAERHAAEAKPTPARAAADDQVQANSPPFSEGIYPCSGCHDPSEKPNTERRELQFHSDPGEPAAVFDHDSAHRWCLDCHDAQDRDVLRSASGTPIPFTESYLLCGQCHGDKYRDWRAGVHGKRVGRWNGEKTYFLCVNCHNPHTPGWKGVKEAVVEGKRVVMPTLQLLKPEPRPMRPEEMRK
jgi:hypothetical protein